jgi:hypothetical protein
MEPSQFPERERFRFKGFVGAKWPFDGLHARNVASGSD